MDGIGDLDDSSFVLEALPFQSDEEILEQLAMRVSDPSCPASR